MKAPRARCPVCFKLVLAERPRLEALIVVDVYFLEEHKRDEDGKGRRCPGSDSRISAMKLEGLR